MIKAAIRTILFPFMVLVGGEVEAKTGTLKYKFLNWLYGDPEPIHDGWIYPE